MQVESPELLRNLAVVGHNDTGKTTLVSALLYAAGVTSKLHRIEDGNTLTDFDAEEIHRGISIGLATCYAPWQKHKINLIDCPGSSIFLAESRAGMRATDAALLCVNSVAGIQVTTEKLWEHIEANNNPVLLCVTKMDRENADFERIVAGLQEKLGRAAVPIQVPIGSEQDFRGVVDLVSGQAQIFERDGSGKAKPAPVPADLTATVEEWRGQLVELVAETDEALMEAFFEAGDLTEEQLTTGLRKALLKREVFPIVLTAALHGIGPSALLDTVLRLAPNPIERETFPGQNAADEPLNLAIDCQGPASALVFKTISDPFAGRLSLVRVVSGTLNSDSTYWNGRTQQEEKVGHLQAFQGKQSDNVPLLITGDIGGIAKLKTTQTGDTLHDKAKPVRLRWLRLPTPAISFAIEPKAKTDEEKIGDSCGKLVDEDPTLRAGRDPQTGEFLLSGTGQLHVEIAVAKLKSRYKVDVILHPPKVPYRETVKKPAPGHGRHKKQSGGRGQFADCRITIEPLQRGGEFEFADEIFGGSIPHNYRPAVEKGVREAAERGFLAGFHVVDFKVRLQDGQYHDVDSSEMAFKIAGSLAFKDAMANASPTILEPVMQMEIHTTDEFMGDIMSDLSQRRGRPQGMESRGENQVIKALAPMAEVLNYETSLRAMTQGRSTFSMEYSHYEEVPRPIQEKLISEARKPHDD